MNAIILCVYRKRLLRLLTDKMKAEENHQPGPGAEEIVYITPLEIKVIDKTHAT
jgi:hypothetical protein